MTFFAITSAYGVQLGLEYDRRAFGDPVAGQVLDLFVAAMTALVQTPEQTGQAVVASVLRPSVQTGAPLADLTPLFDRIHHAALRTPQAAAVVCGEQSLDWAGLMIRAQRIAAALREHGVQRGDRVAIALPRGASFIAAILACMGTGAAYVPIDVTYPQDRIGQVLAAAQPKLVLGKDEGLRIDESGINAVPWADLPRLDLVPPDPGGVAYVMFTSGSTGAPLGVPITHAQLSHSTNARAQAYDAAPTRFALLSSLGFDSSVAGLFWTLAEGGTLVLPDVATLRDPVALTRVLHDGISHVLLVPTLYNALLDHTQGDDWPSCVIVAGEACSPALVRRHFTRFPQTTLSNEYGPTEGTVWALSHRISPDDRPVPLGQPVAGCWAAVVDRAGQVLAQGASGELVIGGPLITSGYVGGRGTQATRFLTGGTGDLPAGPAFRTGDRAVFDGVRFDFLGRLDNQLNVGGIRLSPVALETVLMRQPGVHEAAVVAHDGRDLETLFAACDPDVVQKAIAASANAPDPQQALIQALRDHAQAEASIVAHLETSGPVDEPALRCALADAFPIGQRPAHLVLHQTLPRLPNGKIDRRALGDISPARPVSVTDPAPGPEGVDLDSLTKMFAKELASPGFGPDDDFFEHGGYSLLALRLLLQIETRFATSLSTAALYETPSPRAFLAAHLGRRLGSEGDQPARRGPRPIVIPYATGGTGPALFAIHSLDENGNRFRPLAARLGPDVPFHGVGENGAVSMGLDWVRDPNASAEVTDQAAIYGDEIEALSPTGPLVLVGYCLGALFAYEVAQQLAARGRAPALLVMIHDLHAPLLASRSMGSTSRKMQARLAQIRTARWATVRRAVQKLPTFAVRSWHATERQLEIAALKRARTHGRVLGKRLASRDFVERSYLASKRYDYAPYAGRTLILREAGNEFYDPERALDGWGDLLSDAAVQYTPSEAFRSLVDEPHVGALADHIAAELARIDPVAKSKPTPPRNRALVGQGHRITLETDVNFIATPRSELRDWLLHQRLRDLSQDLEHLNIQATLDPDEIMEDWQIPLMRRMADLVAGPGGDILEIGFGRGILSDFVQAHPVNSHAIVECNPHLIDDYHHWAARHPQADLRLIEGLWQDVSDQFAQYDGILFHTYPLDQDELVETLAQNATFAQTFFATAARALRPGGRFTYFTNEADSLSRAHQRALLDHFDGFTVSRLARLNISDDTADAHWFNSIVVVVATRAT